MVGKIARLPAEIREEINNRLYNGKSGPEILAWLNELCVVKEILAAKFDSAPVNENNLSSWRAIGYQRWLAEQNNVDGMKNTAKYAVSVAEAAGGSISRGVAAFASGKILQFLETPYDKTTPENLVKLANASARLCRSEQNAVRLDIAHERLRQRERRLILIRDQQQRDVVAIAFRVLGDARAKAACERPHQPCRKNRTHRPRHLWRPLRNHAPFQPNNQPAPPASAICPPCCPSLIKPSVQGIPNNSKAEVLEKK